MQTLFKDIKGLVGCYDNSPPFLAGDEMRQFTVLENAWMTVEGKKITGFGSMSKCPKGEGKTVVCSGR